MSDKYVNETGLAVIRDWANGKFALDADLDTLDAKVDDIIAEGGEPNVIEIVKVNDTALTPDAQKAVNVEVPTLTSDLTNDGDGTDSNSPFATQAYVAANGGKIDVIKVNGTAQTITNKEVDLAIQEFNVIDVNVTPYNEASGFLMASPKKPILLTFAGRYLTITDIDFAQPEANADIVIFADITFANNTIHSFKFVLKSDNSWGIQEFTSTIPTVVSQLTNDANYQTDTDVAAAISTAVASAYKYKGSVATYQDLPASGNTAGDVWDVQADGMNYAWTGTAWDALGQYVDTSVLWTSTAGQSNSLVAMTTAEINAILNPSA